MKAASKFGIVQSLEQLPVPLVLCHQNFTTSGSCVNDENVAVAFKNGEWLRVAGELVEDDRREARQSMLDAYPSLQKMYSADDGNTEVFYFKNATATFSSFTH